VKRRALTYTLRLLAHWLGLLADRAYIDAQA
jgi:hypothetical protein